MLLTALANIRKHQFRRERHTGRKTAGCCHTAHRVQLRLCLVIPLQGKETHIFSICSQGGNKTSTKDQLLKTLCKLKISEELYETSKTYLYTDGQNSSWPDLQSVNITGRAEPQAPSI